ncbi:hypothetical protein ACFPFV_12585 [Salinicoccus siamensis]
MRHLNRLSQFSVHWILDHMLITSSHFLLNRFLTARAARPVNRRQN